MKLFFFYITCILAMTIQIPAQQMQDFDGQVFPVNHALNTRIDSLPVHPNSNLYIASIGANTALHPDFGTDYDGYPMGMPYNLVGAGQPMLPIAFEYESDPGPYPIPVPPLVEGLNTYTEDNDGDRHILVIDTSSHILYETWYSWPPGHAMPSPADWDTYPPSNPASWWAGSGAVFDLTSNNLRPDGWTSADAAGLPIFPLLIRYDEVSRAMATGGEIPHAIRVTVSRSQAAYIWPATHYASSSGDTARPPMGLRLRLKSDVDISGFTSRIQVILRTLKKYGFIVADNGSNWYFQGTHDDRWDDEELNSLKTLHGRDFEVVDISPWINDPDFDPNSAAVPAGAGSYIPRNNPNTPAKYILYQNNPNPFNPSTKITFVVPPVGILLMKSLQLKIYDILGREIITLVDGIQTEGQHTVEWDGRDSHGLSVSSGFYFYQLKSESGFNEIRKMILLK